MAKDKKIRMPSGQGGLVQYFEDYNSKISFKPISVIIIAIVILIIVIVLHSQGNSWLGF